MTERRAAGRSDELRLAVFVSPHGFGHAARAAAVLAALREQRPRLAVTVYTTVPRWFFAESLSFSVFHRELACDVGLVQKSALEEDLPATVARLEELWTQTRDLLSKGVVSEVRDSGAEAVVCDIAPLGLTVAREAGLPSILVESFTWDWIYEPLVAREPRLAPWVERMRDLFALADLRIRCEPHCDVGSHPPSSAGHSSFDRGSSPAPFGASARPHPPSTASLSNVDRRETPAPLGTSARPVEPESERSLLSIGDWPSPEELRLPPEAVDVPPIARRPRSTPAAVRARLALAPAEAGRPLVLVSMGGIEWSYANFDRLRAAGEVDFVVPGGAGEEIHDGKLRLLPHHSPVHHPDLVAAADAVVGKLGYSTVAEAVGAGTRYLYPPRPAFREHPLLAAYVAAHLPSAEIPLGELASGEWVSRLPSLLARRRPEPDRRSGAAAAARAIVDRIAG
jgi:hypothetical protein